MKPALVGIFAHPDDESFGPCGTLHLYTKTHDVYIICATRGDAGQNNDLYKDNIDLALIREQELRDSAEVIGVKEVFFLDYKDGMLCNNIYHDIAGDVQKILDRIKPEILMTYDQSGISGHIDHITMSMVTSFIFEKVEYARTLLYFCLNESQRKLINSYFIYVPPGKKRNEIHKRVDVTSILEKKKEAIFKHVTQIKDAERILKRFLEQPKLEECFLVWEK